MKKFEGPDEIVWFWEYEDGDEISIRFSKQGEILRISFSKQGYAILKQKKYG